MHIYICTHTHTHIYCFPTVVGFIDFELAIDPNQEQMAVRALVVHLSVLNSNNEEAAVCVYRSNTRLSRVIITSCRGLIGVDRHTRCVVLQYCIQPTLARAERRGFN